MAGHRLPGGGQPLGALAVLDGLLLLAWSRLLVRRLTTSGSAGGVRGSGSSSLGIAALWIAFFAAMQVGNLYGFDGTSVWQALTTPGAARFDVRGR
ncbi:MAG TPA: hypothetical protein VH141_34730 [Pseudonocardia sp.]|nr:hypothetical protein [Pseudonocardia sp.]